MPSARYEGVAAWYDSYQAGDMREVTELAESLARALLPPGAGLALDLGCGTGRHYGTVRALGYVVVGIDVSADQLHRACSRGESCVQADAAHLPFAEETFRTIATIMTATDFDDLRCVLADANAVDDR
jgi:ubiquinone/menaquinone biosynthesis C-methylase UbiE